MHIVSKKTGCSRKRASLFYESRGVDEEPKPLITLIPRNIKSEPGQSSDTSDSDRSSVYFLPRNKEANAAMTIKTAEIEKAMRNPDLKGTESN